MYPVFMYHKVGAPVSGRADTFLNVSAHNFRRQMRVLAKLGYSVRPFAEIAEATKGDRPVMIFHTIHAARQWLGLHPKV